MCFSKKEKDGAEEITPARPRDTVTPQRNASIPVKISPKGSGESPRNARVVNGIGKAGEEVRNGSAAQSDVAKPVVNEGKHDLNEAPTLIQSPSSAANQDQIDQEKKNEPDEAPNRVPNASSAAPQDSLQTSSLWREALNQLDTKKKDALEQQNDQSSTSISTPPSSGMSLVDGVMKSVVEKRKACEDKRWRFTFRGREIILSDVADKAIVWIKHFESIGDTAAGFDPIHAGIPWAGVKTILQLTTAAKDQYAAILISIERIFHLIDRCRVYELLYPEVNNDTPISDQSLINLKGALLKLYQHILDSLATTIILFSNHGYQRAFHALANPGEVDGFLTAIKTQEDTVETEAENCERVISRSQDEKAVANFDALKAKLHEINQPIVRIDDRVAALMRNVEAADRAAALGFISNIASLDDHAFRAQKRTPGTGKWLLQHGDYTDWRNMSASTIVWLHGIPGAGKSTLVSSVIDDLEGSLRAANATEALAYFYCDRNAVEHRDPALILRSLVKQLCVDPAHENSIHPAVWNSYAKRKNSGFLSKSLSVDECLELLLELANFFPQTNIVLDALDECDDEARITLMEAIDHLVDQATRPVKVFISSREREDISRRFDTGPNIGIQAWQNEGDINIHVEAKLAEDSVRRLKYHGKTLSKGVKDDIIAVMRDKSGGMFQWVALHIDELLKETSEKAIRAMLGQLPRGLEAAYDRIFAEIDTQEPTNKRLIARRAFQWVSCAHMPLMEETLFAAVCQDPNEDSEWDIDVDTSMIKDACRNLVQVQPAVKRWQFSHLSVQEYLEKKVLNVLDTHRLILAVCLRRLCDPRILEKESRFRTHYWQLMDWNKINPRIAKENDDKHPPDIMDVWNVSTSPRVAEQSDIINSINTPMFALLCLLDYATMWWPAHYQRIGDQHMDANLTTLLHSFLGSLLKPGRGFICWQQYSQVARKNPREAYLEFPIGMGRGNYEYIDRADKVDEPVFLMCLIGIYHPVKEWWDELDNPKFFNEEQGGEGMLKLALMGENVIIANRILELHEKAGLPPFGSDLRLRPPGRLTREEVSVVSADLPLSCFERFPRSCDNCDFYITTAGKECKTCGDWHLCDFCANAGDWKHIEGHKIVDVVLPNFYDDKDRHDWNAFWKWRTYEA